MAIQNQLITHVHVITPDKTCTCCQMSVGKTHTHTHTQSTRGVDPTYMFSFLPSTQCLPRLCCVTWICTLLINVTSLEQPQCKIFSGVHAVHVCACVCVICFQPATAYEIVQVTSLYKKKHRLMFTMSSYKMPHFLLYQTGIKLRTESKSN